MGVKKYIFDVFGDTVNTAFRLEALSAPMGLTISASLGVINPALPARGAGPGAGRSRRPG